MAGLAQQVQLGLTQRFGPAGAAARVWGNPCPAVGPALPWLRARLPSNIGALKGGAAFQAQRLLPRLVVQHDLRVLWQVPA
jgi:hypothetical protein